MKRLVAVATAASAFPQLLLLLPSTLADGILRGSNDRENTNSIKKNLDIRDLVFSEEEKILLGSSGKQKTSATTNTGVFEDYVLDTIGGVNKEDHLYLLPQTPDLILSFDDLNDLSEANIQDETQERILREDRSLSDSSITGNFSPLSCNGAYTACTPWNTTLPLTAVMTIPCGTCISMDFTQNEVIDLPGTLNIEGKLVVPNNAKFTLKTDMIVVQGELEMTKNNTVKANPEVSFIMKKGATSFTPHSQNAGVCTGSCVVGHRAVVIAGGKLNIRGLSPSCPAWSPVVDVVPSGMVVPPLGSFSTAPDPKPGCASNILSETFSGPHDWDGNLGAFVTITNETSWDGKSNYMKVSNRLKSWQGPHLELSSYMDCFEADVDYFIEAQVRIVNTTDTPEGSECSREGKKCIKFRGEFMQSTDMVKFVTLHEMSGLDAVPDNTWFTYRGSFKFNGFFLASGNVYRSLSIEGPEEGLELHVGDIQIYMAPPEAFPSQDVVCKDLFVNGDAGSTGGYSYPWKPFVKNEAEITIVDYPAAPYFRLSDRFAEYSSLTTLLPTGCTVAGAKYLFNVDILIHAEDTVEPIVIIRTWRPDGTFLFNQIAKCPSMNQDGWVNCKSQFMFGDVHASSPKIELLFVFPGDKSSVIDFDNLHFAWKEGGGADPKVESSVGGCWDVGATVGVPSSTLLYESSARATIAAVNSNTGQLTLDGSFEIPESKLESPNTFGRIALLSRNIEFRSDDTDIRQGGQLIVLHTPNVQQILEGVAFRYFGQQGVKDAYPVHFHHSGDSQNSLVSKNSVYDSNRCIVLSGTQNVQVHDNVGFDIKGYCFAVTDGSATQNYFYRNLGALVKKTSIRTSPEEPDDKLPAVFYITNPNNSYLENVAGGSEDSGFFFNLDTVITGTNPLAYKSLGAPCRTPLMLFKDNVSHSNRGMGVRAFPSNGGYNPMVPVTFQTTRTYRNRGFGFYFVNGQNLVIDGGYIADNQLGIDLHMVDDAFVKNVDIIGQSPEYNFLVSEKLALAHCLQGSLIVGMRIHPNVKDNTKKGPTIENINFGGFNEGCTNGNAIAISGNIREALYTAPTTFTNITFDPATVKKENLMNACDAANKMVLDMNIPDYGGGFNKILTNDNENGFVVSDTPAMTGGGGCTKIPGSSCTSYCVGSRSCVRKITIGVDPQGTKDFHLKASDGQGTIKTGESSFANSGDDLYDTFWSKMRYFSLSLSSGDWNVYFETGGGNPAHVNFAKVILGDEPSCVGYMDSYTFTTPSVAANTCNTLISDPGFESAVDGYTGFMHTGGGTTVLTSGAFSGSKALKTTKRTSWNDGPAVYLDNRCFNEGDKYEVTAKIKIVDSNGNGSSCDPKLKSGNMKCPVAHIKALKDGATHSWAFHVGTVQESAASNGWMDFSGFFTVDSTMSEADQFVLFVVGLRENYNFYLDNFQVTKLTHNCNSNYIMNGDFDSGQTQFWKPLGGARLSTSTTAASGAKAMKVQGRTQWWEGPKQSLDMKCFQEGQELIVSAKVMLAQPSTSIASSITEYECDPLLSTGGLECPFMWLEIGPPANSTYTASTWKELARTLGPKKPGYKNMWGILEVTADIANASKLNLLFNKGKAGIDMLLDSVEIKLNPNAPQFGCDELVKFGDFENGDVRFFSVLGYGAFDMYSPGRGGSQYALQHSNRLYEWNGIRQEIDQDCLSLSSEWVVSAYFRILDNNGNGVSCDKTARFGANVCPVFTVFSIQGSTPNYYTLWNTNTESWNANGWNTYTSIMTVSNEMMTYDTVSLFASKAPQGVTIVLDDFSITKKPSV